MLSDKQIKLPVVFSNGFQDIDQCSSKHGLGLVAI